LGAAAKSYLDDRSDLKDEILGYLVSTTYDRPEMDCTHFLLDTYLGGESFDTDTRFYTASGVSYGQTAASPDLAISFSLTADAIANGFEGFGNVLRRKGDTGYFYKKRNALISPYH